MTEKELNILSRIKVRPLEEQRDFLLEQNMLLTGKMTTLEKENAELKAIVRNTKAVDESFALQTIQLTKAKFLLKQLVDAFPKSYSDVVKNTLKQAEQFLNSEVEK